MVANAKGDNEWARWNGPSQEHEAFIDGMLQSPAHIIATMRSKTAWVIEDVERHGRMVKAPRRIGMAPKQREGTEFEFTTVLDLEVPTNQATCTKDRTELFKIGEKVARDASYSPAIHSLGMGPDWGARFINWVYSAAKPEPLKDAEPTPAMRALAVCEAGIRSVNAAPNVPDLQIAFDKAQKALRAQSITAGADCVVPLIERLVEAKDLRKDFLRPPKGQDPAIVRDLAPGEVTGAVEATAPTALDLARASCEKIAAGRPGLFSDMSDDTEGIV